MGKDIIIKGADFRDNAIAPVPVISITRNGVVSISAYGALSIHYTTDGTTPTVNSQEYSTSFTVADGITVKAIAVYASSVSKVVSATYSMAISNTRWQIENAELLIGYWTSASARMIGKELNNNRATVTIPIGYKVIDAPLTLNNATGHTSIGILDGVRRITLKMANSSYYYGLALYENSSTYYDSGYIQGGSDSTVSYEPDSLFSGNCWLACTMKIGEEGTTAFTDETLESIGWECIVE